MYYIFLKKFNIIIECQNKLNEEQFMYDISFWSVLDKDVIVLKNQKLFNLFFPYNHLFEILCFTCFLWLMEKVKPKVLEKNELDHRVVSSSISLLAFSENQD